MRNSLVLRALLLFGFLGTAHAAQDTIVVFNEVMYNPPGDDPEWIELRNLNGVDVDISNWRLDGAVDYTFPDGTVILGNALLLVSSDVVAMPTAMGPFSGRLDDDGEEIRLLNNSDRVMCILDYNDSGNWPVAPDGSGATLAKREPMLLSSEAESWTWSAEVGGTPGMENFPNGSPNRDLVAINEIAGLNEENFFIELGVCPCPDPLADFVVVLSQYRLRSSNGDVYDFADQSLIAGGLLAIDRETLELENELERGDRLFLTNEDGTQIIDAVRVRARSRSRLPDGNGTWYVSSADTPNEANNVELETAIVINEIMYSHRPRYESEVEGEPYARNSEEWIELFNRGSETIDLTGWELDGGARFEFPDGTMIESGAYLVVSNDGASLKAVFPEARIIGDFRGALRNREDTIELLNAAGNPVDFVHYHDGGAWPAFADAGGSSLELINPFADNSKASSWAASDESRRSAWKEYQYSGIAERPPGTNFPRQWNEFIFGLLDAGEFLIDDLSVTEDPGGAGRRMLQNGSFNRTIFGGDGTQDWRFLGNHGGHGKTRIVPDPEDDENTVLHVVATSPTEHMHNHAETTLSGNTRVSEGTEYEIKFRAKWLRGSPQLNTRLYFNYLGKTTILELPDANGTPGGPNSTFQENIGPVYSDLMHTPAVPGDQEPITITVDAQDHDGIESLNVMWRETDEETFQALPMENVGGQRYQATIPGQAARNLFGAATETKLHYYIEGKDVNGVITQYPKGGPESRALIPLTDDRESEGPGHNLRIVMTEADTEFLHETTNVMSNHRMLCTLIYQEREVFYDVGVRLKGSQRGRDKVVRAGFSLRMPADNRFRGLHGTIAVDRSGSGDEYSQKEILVKHGINRAGNIPGMYDDLIHVITPDDRHTGAAMLLMARYDNEFLDGQWENGSDGRMFEYELIYYPTSTVGGPEGLKRPNPDSVSGVPHRDLGDNKDNYRWNYQIDNNQDADDYSSLMEVLRTLGMSANDEFFERLHQYFDIDQWLRSYAIQTLYGISDNYVSGSQHNMIIYIHPNGKAMYFPWDMDFTFRQGQTAGISLNGDLNKMLRDPLIERSYLAQMNELLLTGFNQEYMARWAEHYSTFLPSENLATHVNYIDRRNRHIAGAIRSRFPKVPFKITSNDGEAMEVAASTITLEGEGWLDVATVSVGDTEYELEWYDRDKWRLTLPLMVGENVIDLQAKDILGGTGSIFSPIGSDSITITNTGSLESASADNLVVSEIMYHPATPSEAEIEAGFTDQDLFEYIELQNIGENVIDLTGVRFTRGIDLDFTEGSLAPGAFAVLVSNEDAFKQRYPNVVITGVYDNQLRNSGESVRLRAVDNEIIKEFSYGDNDPWPRSADGEGHSLVLVDSATNPDHDVAASWTASVEVGGSPGVAEAPGEPDQGYAEWLAERGGDGAADPNGDGIPLLLDYAFGADLRGGATASVLPTASADPPGIAYVRRSDSKLTYDIEFSADLTTWRVMSNEELDRTLLVNQDGTSSEVAMPKEPGLTGYLRIHVKP